MEAKPWCKSGIINNIRFTVGTPGSKRLLSFCHTKLQGVLYVICQGKVSALPPAGGGRNSIYSFFLIARKINLLLFLKTIPFHQTFMKLNKIFYGNRVFKKIDNKWITLRPYRIIIIYRLRGYYNFCVNEEGPDLF